jgi:hypothetical protein
MLSTSLIFPRSKGVIGLDIGTNSIKLIEIEESKGVYRLKEFGMTPLPNADMESDFYCTGKGTIFSGEYVIRSGKQW